MTRPANAHPFKKAAQQREWCSRGWYAGAGASVPTKVRGIGQALTRTGVGLYTMTFTDVGGQLVGLRGTTHTVATVIPQVWKLVPGSYSAANKSVNIECWDLGAVGGVLADPPATANTFVELEFTFLDNVASVPGGGD